EIACRQRFPNVKDRRHDAPSRLDLIRSLEECGVADHAVIQEPLVTCGYFILKVVSVVKVHVDRSDVDYGAGYLGTKVQGDALVRLYMDHQAVGSKPLDPGLTEKHKRSFLEFDDNGRISGRHAFTRSYIKRHVRPAPVVDL